MINDMFAFFRVDRIAVTLLGYPLSYVELLGTVFNLWSVWLATRNRVAAWPVGLVGVGLFLALFYQIRLYSDVFEQVYYLGASVYGWWQWGRASGGGPTARQTLPIRLSAPRTIVLIALVTLALSLPAGWLTSRLHVFYPTLFPEAASYPYVDATTTVMSFTATLLMAQRRLECWWYWIIIDVVGVWLYYSKGVLFVAILFGLFVVLAAKGLLFWRREAHRQEGQEQAAAAV